MIRQATISDLDALVELGREMVAEAPEYEGLSFNGGRLRKFVRWAMGDGDGLALIAEMPTEPLKTPVGCIVVFPAPYAFADDVFVADLGLYIRPGHRKGRLAVGLVRRVEDWCREQGYDDIQLGVSTGVHLDRTSSLYESLGYRESGRTFRKRLSA